MGSVDELRAIRGGVARGNEYRVLNMPRVSVGRSAAKTLAGATLWIIEWDALEYDTDSLWNSADPTKITANTPGLYQFDSQAYIQGAGSLNTYRQIYFQKFPGGAVYGQVVCAPCGAVGVGTCTPIASQIPLSKDDYVTVNYAHNDSSLSFNVGIASTWVRACLISTLG